MSKNSELAEEAARYKRLRQSIGKQKVVAEALGIAPETLCKREAGSGRITTEAWIAMRTLHFQSMTSKNS